MMTQMPLFLQDYFYKNEFFNSLTTCFLRIKTIPFRIRKKKFNNVITAKFSEVFFKRKEFFHKTHLLKKKEICLQELILKKFNFEIDFLQITGNVGYIY